MPGMILTQRCISAPQAILLYSSKRFPNKFVPITGTDTLAAPAAAPSADAMSSPVADSPGQPSPGATSLSSEDPRPENRNLIENYSTAVHTPGKDPCSSRMCR
jgi:hypothetical protein